jgi:hypothetical protein
MGAIKATLCTPTAIFAMGCCLPEFFRLPGRGCSKGDWNVIGAVLSWITPKRSPNFLSSEYTIFFLFSSLFSDGGGVNPV